MAYGVICEPCLDSLHDACQQASSHEVREDGFFADGWVCFCSHQDKPTSSWEQSLLERSIQRRIARENP